MEFPQVANAAGSGGVVAGHSWECTRIRTWPLLAPVPTYCEPEPGMVQVDVTSEVPPPTAWGCAGGAGRGTQPAGRLAVQATLQLQIETTCCGVTAGALQALPLRFEQLRPA